ncbi:MAG TPA: LlaJI family restriction endonuclease [Candidatus Avamphibacillus sp.]|nr:LlaJI family restriction endonuclease [Candidatus Avamphibacillus sp.]
MDKHTTIYSFIEQEEYPLLVNQIPNDLFLNGLCIKIDDKVKFNFTGVVLVNTHVIVVFPKGYIIPDNNSELKKHAITLLDTLLRYRQKKDIPKYEKELLGGIGKNESISAAFWILKDYLEYGLINVQDQQYSRSSNGIINWGRTIKKIDPIVSNNKVLYLDFITEKNNVDVDNTIYQIHKYAVNKSLGYFGWLMDMDYENYNAELWLDKDTAIHYLEIELQRTFTDREVNLYKKLIEFLAGASEKETGEKVVTFLTPYFHVVWESVCNFIFSGAHDEDVLIPRPFWNINNKKKYTKQIPDTIFKYKKSLFILDAKYYKLNKLPGWGDLVKQFFYANTLSVSCEIKNILLFPNSNKDTSVNYLGYAAIENNRQFGRINGYTVDIYIAMKSYVNYDKGDFQAQLISLENKCD